MGQNLELTRIKGIGAARARWLSDAFGARDADELARLAPEDIQRRLEADRRPAVSRGVIDGWIADAQALASQAKPAWTSLASFVVDFQTSAKGGGGGEGRTSVHHLEQDKTETWPGMERERLCQWMLAQLPQQALEERARPSSEPQRSGDTPHSPAVPALDAQVLVGRNGHGAAPIPIDTGWSVAFEWSVEGVGILDLGGEWRLDVLLQPLGVDAPALRLREAPVSVAARPGVQSYRELYEVPAGTVRSFHCGKPYRGVAVLAYQSGPSGHAHPAGFAQLGDLFFWSPSGSGSRPVRTGAPQAASSISA